MNSTNSRHKPLGRGLAALIPDDLVVEDDRSPASGGIRTVPLDSIRPNPEQPRKDFTVRAMEELATSIAVHGIMNPLVVRPDEDGGYVLIAGERRLRAAGQAGLLEVPVVVREGAEDPAVQLELALVENLQREDLNPIESARGYQRLIDGHGYTQAEVAEKVGKDRATVANAVRLLKLPEKIIDLIRDGRLSAGHGRALLAVDDPDRLRMIVAQVLARNLSVRATERLSKSRSRGRRTPVATENKEKALGYAEKLLGRALSTQVQIKPKGKGGRIFIDYYSNDELERLIHHLRGEFA